MTTRPPPVPVPRFDFDFVRILRFLLAAAPVEPVLPALLTKRDGPATLTPAGLALAQDTLSKGLVLILVRAGGWRDDVFLRDGRPSSGRVWNRLPLDERALTVGVHTLSFVTWLTVEKVVDPSRKWDAPATQLTPADELFFLLAFEAMKADATLFQSLRGKAVFARNPLCWLMHPGEFADGNESCPPVFAPLFHGTRAMIVECLQPRLTAAWLKSEHAKRAQPDWTRMRQQGEAEFAALTMFLAAAEEAGRFDLARFLLPVLAKRLANSPDQMAWTGGLQGPGPLRLADRIETQRAALAVVRQSETFARWDRQARSVGYFDDGYALSQWWKETYESAGGNKLAATAKRLVERLDPLKAE